MRRLLALAVALVACAALPAACAGEDTSESAPAEPQPAAGQPPTDADGEINVAMRNFQFIPRDVTVEEGGTITWVNEDPGIQHDAVADGDRGPDSELFNHGESYSWTAGGAGRIRYVCTIHPGMEGTITVR